MTYDFKNVVPDLVVAARPLDVTKTLQDESDRNWQICEPCIAKKCLLDGKPRDYQCTQETTLQVNSERNPKNTELDDSENSALAVCNENQQEKRGSCVNTKKGIRSLCTYFSCNGSLQ
ncbi:hypothetical protein C5167_006918 [Papaver somniferum]|uniref:Uncharacterized protein n=1 Tax=Papaver somniferum TaxID=3469 RepID=A0A4Y7JEU7_PAPSO|nr:hypothetical protein C5167_006918 [Papaver somniferum]